MMKFLVHIAWRADFVFDDPMVAMDFARWAANNRYNDGEKQDDEEIKITFKKVDDTFKKVGDTDV